MKTAYRYLSYELKKNLLRTVIFTVISVVLCLMVMRSEATTGDVQWRSTGIYMLAIVIGVLATVMPMLELSEFKNRRNLDTLYFFPIERKKLALVHYLSGLIQVAAIYTVTFAVSFIFLLLNTDCFALGYMIPYYFASLGTGFVMYSFFSFTFNQGNTVTDGVIISLLWAFVAYCVLHLGTDVMFGQVIYLNSSEYRELRRLYKEVYGLSDWGIVYAPINNVTVIFQNAIEVNRHRADYVFENTSAYGYIKQWYMFAVWGVAGIVSAVGFIFSFARKGAHMAGELSSSWFGYKTLIPVYGYSIILYLASFGSNGTLFILTLIMMFIGYVIYRRSFKLKKSDIIVLACSIVPFILGLFIKNMYPF